MKIENVTVKHVDGLQPPILREVSCEIPSGTITLLVGQTGAGKSSLLDVLTGLRKADSGDVFYEQRPLWVGGKLNRDVQAEIGVVFQYPEHQLFARTVEKEFAYSLQPLGLSKEQVQARAREALGQMGLPESLLHQSPLTLSGGQKRRVALGTTFATRPKWLFLDEPTAGLDPQSVQRLVDFLLAWRQETGGSIVMATHDLDAMFPIADRVLVLEQGRLLADLTPLELCERPDVLEQARIGLPSSTQIGLSLREQGFAVPLGPVSPAEMAQAIARELAQGKNMHGDRKAGQQREAQASVSVMAPVAMSATTPMTQEAVTVDAANTSAHEIGLEKVITPPENPVSLVHALDPRAKWVFYLLFSLGILLQNSWSGLLVVLILTLGTLLISHVPRKELLRVTKPFLFFIVFSVVLSGLRIGEVQGGWHVGSVGFDVASAAFTFKQVFKILLVMALGVILTTTTSQLRMKRGLEQSLAPLARLKLPVEAFSLAASLMLRFIPVIMRELERFSRITRARGKSNAKLGSLRLRDVTVIIIPLLLSVLQLGEDLSLAMEARGYANFGNKRTSSIELRMNRTDRLTMLCAVVFFLFLLGLTYL